MEERLLAIGDVLQRATARDLQRRRTHRWRLSPRVVASVIAAVVVVPAAALAATGALKGGQVATGLKRGTLVLGQSEPLCVVVKENIEYQCKLASAPPRIGDEPGETLYGRPRGRAHLFVMNPKTGRTWSVLSSNSRSLVRAEVREIPLRPAWARAITELAIKYRSPTRHYDWFRATEPTINVSKHINGGCRSLNRIGTSWDCYLGRAAVQHDIIGAKLLGQYAPVPSVG